MNPETAPGYWPTRIAKYEYFFFGPLSTSAPMLMLKYFDVFVHEPLVKAYDLPATFTVAFAEPQNVTPELPPELNGPCVQPVCCADATPAPAQRAAAVTTRIMVARIIAA